MKTKFTMYLVAAMLFTINLVSAQAPQGVNYQAVIRDGSGNLITSGTVALRFTIRKTTAAGTNVYQETHNVDPNAYGLVTSVIGAGTKVGANTFASVNWSNDKYFLQVEADPAGGTNFTSLGAATQFESVPYALSALDNQWTKNGNNISNNNSGNVGIGVAAPLEKLAVNGNILLGDDTADIDKFFFIKSSGEIEINANTSGANTSNIALWLRAGSGAGQASIGLYGAEFLNEIVFKTKGATRMTITADGKAGIGISEPKAQLHTVSGIGGAAPSNSGNVISAGLLTRFASSGGAAMDFGMLSDGSNWIQGNLVNNQATKLALLLNPAGGNVAVGQTTAGYKLTVNGQPAANGYTLFTNYSDARLKTNVAEVESSLGKILQLRPVQYNYNETYLKLYNEPTALTRLHKGFIAQEVKEVFPEMVGEVNMEGTNYYDLNLSNLQVYMVKAMQEQQAQIEALKTENNTLKAENATYKTGIQNLETGSASLKADIDLIKSQLNIRSQANPK